MALKIMQPIDQFVTSKMEQIKQSPQYLALIEDFNNYDEQKQTLLKSLITLLCFLIPLTFVFITFLIHSSLNSKLDHTEEVISTGMRIIEKRRTIEQDSSSLMGKTLSTRNEFNTAIATAATSSGIETNKVTVQSFNLSDEKGFNIVTADVKFNQISNNELFTFIKSINTRNKFKIDEIDIKKNTQTNFLEGLITFMHYGKISSNESL